MVNARKIKNTQKKKNRVFMAPRHKTLSPKFLLFFLLNQQTHKRQQTQCQQSAKAWQLVRLVDIDVLDGTVEHLSRFPNLKSKSL